MDTQGLITGFLLNRKGGGKEIGWPEIETWKPEQGILWVHLDREAEEARRWVRDHSGIDPVTAEALLAEETRPRSFAAGEGLIVILRGVNLNPGDEPEDMVALRIFADKNRIISIRRRRLMAVADLTERLNAGQGPHTTGDFLSTIADLLVMRMEPVIDDLGETCDRLETQLSEIGPTSLRRQLRELRHTAIVLKRYLAPQRDMMGRLQMEPHDWLLPRNRMEVRETGDRIARYVEDLEEVRERSAVLQDELINRLSESSNRTVYVLTIVAAIMLPLSLVTGLLGMNVGGMPGVDHPIAFWIVCLLLLLFGLGQVWLFRRLKWF